MYRDNRNESKHYAVEAASNDQDGGPPSEYVELAARILAREFNASDADASVARAA